jgi:hypothetical protein
MSAQLTRQPAQATMAQPTFSAGGGSLRRAWHHIRVSVAEMNYGARRVVELQAPWAVDEHRPAR